MEERTCWERKGKKEIVVNRSFSHRDCILTSLVVMMMLLMMTADKVLRIAIVIVVTAVAVAGKVQFFLPLLA